MKSKIKYSEVSIYIIALLIILSHSIYAYINSVLPDIIYVVLTFSPLLYLGVRPVKINLNKRFFSVFLGYYFVVVFYFLVRVSPDRFFSYICRFIIFVPLMMIVFLMLKQENRQNEVFKAISDFMVIICLFSLFFWVFGTIFHLIPPSGRVYAVWGNDYRNIYYGLYLEVPGRILRSHIERNAGIFCESPAYVCFLSVGYFYEDILSSHFSWSKRIVYIITILSTGTTAGVLVLVYSVLINLWRSSKNYNNKYIKRIFAFFSVFGGGFIVYVVMFNAAKMASVLLRQADYANGFAALKKSPLLGHGYLLDSAVFSAGYSNSLSQIAVNGGLILLSIYFIPMVYTILYGMNRRVKREEYFYWGVLVLILFVLEIIGYAYIMLILLAYGYSLIVCGVADNGNS